MGQLLAHLIGDYILQTDKMATRKTESMVWAGIHAAVYTLPFLFLTRSPWALAAICLTHMLIDRYRLAKYVTRAKNSVTDWPTRAQFATATGYSAAAPAFLSFWLLIITDNTIHLCINFLALRYL